MKAAGTDWLVVYADREHFGNIMHLSGFEPRFEEDLPLLGPGGRRVIITGNESESYTAIAGLGGIEVLRAQTFSLMGQDRSQNSAAKRSAARCGNQGWGFYRPGGLEISLG